MPPPRMFQRRRRQLFALMGQPLFPFLAVLLLAAQCCSAQPHAREDHAQHIMNQARANQKASRPVCNSRVGRARARDLPRRHRAVKAGASMAYDNAASLGCEHESYERRRTKQQREWQRRKHEEGKKATRADNLKAQRQARKDLLKRKRDLAKRKKERDRRKRSVSSAFGEL